MIGAAAGYLLGVVLAPHRSSTFKQPCLVSKQQVVSARSLQPLAMANSRFQYVKKFELSDALLPDTYLVARLDGHRFTKFTAEHGFTKPNDERGLLLMTEVMSEWSDLVMAFGQSDEFSFLLPASSPLYGRRSAKLSTSFVSLFSSSFVFFWPKHFPDTPLLYPPNFDARIVPYPSAQHVRDYFSWRQADCHINNLYNTCFWALVADGVSKQDAQVALKGTTSGDKNELLFSRFDTNYNEIPQRFRKGTTLFRARPTAVAAPPPPPPPEKPSRQPSRQDGAAAVDGSGDKGGRGPRVEGGPVSATATGGETPTAGRQAGETGVEAPRPAAQETNNRVENNVGVETIPDSRPTEDGKPEAGTEGGNAQAGVAASGAATGKGQGDKRPRGRGKGGASEKAGGAPRGDAVVKVVSCSDGKGRAKRLLKKGHAPPGAIEEDACDLIRDDFWDRNPHILATGTMRR